MQHIQEIRKAQALENPDDCEMQVDWKQVAEVHAETLDWLCNSLWQLLYPGQKNWEYPGMVLNHIRRALEEKTK